MSVRLGEASAAPDPEIPATAQQPDTSGPAANMPPAGPPATTEGLPATHADAGRDAELPSNGHYRLGPIDQVPFGEGRTFEVAGEQVAVFRLRNGAIHALSAVCTHRGGPMADGQLDDTIVLCPLHMNAFELATGCSTTGAAPLRRYDVHLDGDQIVVSA